MPGLTNRKKKAYFKGYYEENKDELKEAQKVRYAADPSKKRRPKEEL